MLRPKFTYCVIRKRRIPAGADLGILRGGGGGWGVLGRNSSGGGGGG